MSLVRRGIGASSVVAGTVMVMVPRLLCMCTSLQALLQLLSGSMPSSVSAGIQDSWVIAIILCGEAYGLRYGDSSEFSIKLGSAQTRSCSSGFAEFRKAVQSSAKPLEAVRQDRVWAETSSRVFPLHFGVGFSRIRMDHIGLYKNPGVMYPMHPCTECAQRYGLSPRMPRGLVGSAGARGAILRCAPMQGAVARLQRAGRTRLDACACPGCMHSRAWRTTRSGGGSHIRGWLLQ